MFCQYCGNQLPNDARFCPSCGARVDSQTVVEPARSAEVAEIETPRQMNMVLYIIALIVGLVAIGWTFIFGLVMFGGNLLNITVDGEPVSQQGLLIIGCLLCIPALWKVPLWIVLLVNTIKKKPVGVFFKVAFLLFQNPVSGILLLCSVD